MAALDISVVLQKRELLILPRRLGWMFLYSIADNVHITNFGPIFIVHHWNKVRSVVMADVKGVTMWVNIFFFFFFLGAVESKLWTQYWNHHVVSHESCLCLLEECLIFSLLALVWSGSGFSTEKNIWLVQLVSLSVFAAVQGVYGGLLELFYWKRLPSADKKNSEHSLKCHCYNPLSLLRSLHIIIWVKVP